MTMRALDDADLFDWLRLSRSDNVGPRTFQLLLKRFGTARAALAAVPDLVRRGASRPIVLAPPDEVERELAAIRKAGLQVLPSCDPAYPPLLRGIDAPPPVLLVQGVAAVLQRPCIGIVGSRNASAVGLTMTERLARGVGQGGCVVVSGLARGIDARAHLASLDTGTVAVLAGGHARIYPSEHRGLADRIAETGAVISEMPLGWEPRSRDFPRRNRIVSGLSHAVVVVEAALRSGSLITARYAAEQNRTVFAVPGSPLDPRAEGTNDLIRNGAILCGAAEHILEDLGPTMTAPSLPFALREGAAEPVFWAESDLMGHMPGEGPSPPEWNEPAADNAAPAEGRQRILDLVSMAPTGIDEIVRNAGLPASTVLALLTDMEFGGELVRHPGNAVSRRPVDPVRGAAPL